MISDYDQTGRLYTSLAMQVTAYILGTIVTRMCAVLLVSKQQPGRLYLGLSIMHTYNHLSELNAKVKPSRLLSMSLSLPRATLRLPPVTYIGRADVYCPPGKLSPLQYYLALSIYPQDISIQPVLPCRYFARSGIFISFRAKQ